jgi:hypothetical protein
MGPQMSESKIEIKEEQDPDFGVCIRVHIDGYPRDPFVKKRDKNAEVTLLKATIADLYWESHRNDKKLAELQEFKSTFMKLCRMVGLGWRSQGSPRA